jgi:hypothetical protein
MSQTRIHGRICVNSEFSSRFGIRVYKSEFAGTNKATSATWGVVKNLKREGVAFEHCDLPGVARQGDVHISGDFKAAWFKDPDGNILHINNQ